MQRETPIAKALARVFIAAAWTQGSLQESETDALKDLLFQLPSLSESDWDELEELLEKPVSAKRAESFQRKLIKLLDSEDAMTFAAYALERVTGEGAAGEPPLASTLASLQECIDRVGDEALLCMYGLIQKPLQERLKAGDDEQLRRLGEAQVFLESRMGNLRAGEHGRAIDPEELRRLSLAGILLFFVIQADGKVDENEILTAEKYLCTAWGLSEPKAQFVVQVSLSDKIEDLDLIRVCRWFYEVTTEEERIGFLDVLFDVGTADGELDAEEIDIIMRIAADLRFDQQHFQAALERGLERQEA
ncbi:TerB family tellurite resistance protein [Ruficoccus sp. ZRK36]|uniref:tellurite resistance TerB family protein n=1 Tax=Ruficoccus sp. ZRK36 TaxID=2866311 RepID=UPI001C73264D|nr:TerB family tellurite resistance protein [Ruficoccus sp. ZRK36]QYY35148.1 TerB family tellurite resistance protein [Ruficoccus sp. ZRK36]